MLNCLSLITNQRKTIVTVLLLTAVFFFVISNVFITNSFADKKLTDQLSLDQDQMNVDIVERVDTSGYKLLNIIRSLAVIGAILFLAWSGIIFWGAGGNPQKISEAKNKLIYFFIALVFVFMAENILATLADFFGFSQYLN